MKQSNSNPILKRSILEVVENQLFENDPPAVRATFDRLKQEGCSDGEARRLIGTAVATEVYDILKHQKPFNLGRYTRNLNRLPRMPWDSESG